MADSSDFQAIFDTISVSAELNRRTGSPRHELSG